MSDFDAFYQEHYARVVGSLNVAAGNRAEAEDAAQEAFAKALVRWRSVSVMDRPSTWVYVVAVRELRRRAGRGRGRVVADQDSRADPPMPDHEESVVSAAFIESALQSLAPRQRLAVALRFHADLTVREIARAMRCSDGTVKSTLHAAMKHLRVDLADEEDLEGARDGH